MLVPKVLECVFLLLISQLCLSLCMPTEKLYFDVRPLSFEEKKLLSSWTEESKQNIWELSGQFEGDIILNPRAKNGLIDIDYRWPNKEIPYKFDGSYNLKQRHWITQTLSEFNNKTCIKARLATPQDKDYVLLSGRKSGCFSKVGRFGGPQVINLAVNKPGKGCLRSGAIIHEFLHALGFYHQQSSTERDNFVTIVWENIIKRNKHNFKKYKSNVITNFNQTYDYESVMHYGAYAFSKNGEKTIITKEPKTKIGNKKGFSEIDIIKLHKMYDC